MSKKAGEKKVNNLGSFKRDSSPRDTIQMRYELNPHIRD